MFAEYTKRYLDIILSMLDNVYIGVGDLDALSLKTSNPISTFVVTRHYAKRHLEIVE